MTITILGNFRVPTTFESQQAELFRNNGHKVVCLQETVATQEDITNATLSSELFIWNHTKGWNPGKIKSLLRSLQANGIPYFIGMHHASGYPFDLEFKPRETPEFANGIELNEICHRVTLFRAGDVEDSAAGIFNPSAVFFADTLVEVFRKEKKWLIYMKQYDGGTAVPLLVTTRGFVSKESPGTTFTENLKLKPAAQRWEDFRLFVYDDVIMAGFKVVQKFKEIKVRQGLGFIVNDELKFHQFPDLPIKQNDIECNWTYFTEDKRLYCIYSLRPYKLFYKDGLDSKWERYEVDDPNIEWIKEDFICNSTNPIEVDDYYLMFFHTKDYNNGIYLQGAVLIDKKSKKIIHSTPNCLRIKANNGGWHKVIYVSGALYIKETNAIRVYYGEGDMNACYNEYNKDELIRAIMREANISKKAKAVNVSQKLKGWCTTDKAGRLYDLVMDTARMWGYPLSVEAGVFGGRSLVAMAMAHRDTNRGYAVGIDAWSNDVAIEGTNSKENDDWWAMVNMADVYASFIKFVADNPDLQKYIQWYKLKSSTASVLFPNDSVTLFHQDSNHSSEVIIEELRLWVPKLMLGGFWVVDDIDWESTKEGYAKLPEFGLDLVEKFDTWAIYKKNR